MHRSEIDRAQLHVVWQLEIRKASFGGDHTPYYSSVLAEKSCLLKLLHFRQNHFLRKGSSFS